MGLWDSWFRFRGFRDTTSGVGVQNIGSRVGVQVRELGFRILGVGLGARVRGLGWRFSFEGSGFRV